MVGVEGVPDAQHVRRQADPDAQDAGAAEPVVVRGDGEDQHAPADDVQQQHEARHADDGPPVAAGRSGSTSPRASQVRLGRRRHGRRPYCELFATSPSGSAAAGLPPAGEEPPAPSVDAAHGPIWRGVPQPIRAGARTGKGARRGRWPRTAVPSASARPGVAGRRRPRLQHRPGHGLQRRGACGTRPTPGRAPTCCSPNSTRPPPRRTRCCGAPTAGLPDPARPGRRRPGGSTSRPAGWPRSPDGADDTDVAAAVTDYQRGRRRRAGRAHRDAPAAASRLLADGAGGERPAARGRRTTRPPAPRGQRQRRPRRRLRDALHDGLRRGHGRPAVPPVRGRPPVGRGGRRGGHGARRGALPGAGAQLLGPDHPRSTPTSRSRTRRRRSPGSSATRRTS